MSNNNPKGVRESSNHLETFFRNRSVNLNRPEVIRFQCPLVQVVEEANQAQPLLFFRIFVLGNEFLFVFDQPKTVADRTQKGQKPGLKVDVEVHYFDIISIDYTKKSFKLKVRNATNTPTVYHFRTDDTPTIVAGLFNARLRVGGYWPAITLNNTALRFEITEKWVPKLRTEHFLKTYYAWSSYTGTKSNSIVPVFVKVLENKNNRELDLNQAPGFDGCACKAKYITPFINSLWHDNFFRAFMVRDMSDTNIINSIAGAIENNKHLKKIVINNLSNVTKKSIDRFMSSLENTHHDNLEILDLSSIPWGSIDGLISCLERYTGKFTYINLSRCNLNGTLLSRFFLALASNASVSKSLVTLNLSFNDFDIDDSFSTSNNFRILMQKHGDQMEMQNLHFAGTKCSLKTVFDGIKMLRNIKRLDISNNRFRNTDDLRAVANFIQMAQTLKYLLLSSMEFDLDATQYESQFFQYLLGKNVEGGAYLDISGCPTYATQLPKLISSIQNDNLTKLNISNLSCSDQQFDSLVNSIIQLQNLKKVNVSHIISKTLQPASSRVAVSLVNLCICAHVESIVMHGFGPACIKKLLHEWDNKARTDNVRGKVSSLDVSFNNLGNQGLESLGLFLEENKSLTKVKIDNNNGSYNGWNAIYNSLFFNFTLEKLEWPTVDIMKACSQTLGKFSKPLGVTSSGTPGKKKKKIYNPGPKTSGVLLQEQIMQLMIMIETRLKKYDIPIVGCTGFSFPTTSYEIIPPITGSATPVFMNWDHYAKNDFAKKKAEADLAEKTKAEELKKGDGKLFLARVGITRGESSLNLTGTPRSWASSSKGSKEQSEQETTTTTSSDDSQSGTKTRTVNDRGVILRKHSGTSNPSIAEKVAKSVRSANSPNIQISRGTSRSRMSLGEAVGDSDSSEGGGGEIDRSGNRRSGDDRSKFFGGGRNTTTAPSRPASNLPNQNPNQNNQNNQNQNNQSNTTSSFKSHSTSSNNNSNPELIYTPPANEQMSSSYEKGSAGDATLGGQLKFIQPGNRGGTSPTSSANKISTNPTVQQQAELYARDNVKASSQGLIGGISPQGSQNEGNQPVIPQTKSPSTSLYLRPQQHGNTQGQGEPQNNFVGQFGGPQPGQYGYKPPQGTPPTTTTTPIIPPTTTTTQPSNMGYQPQGYNQGSLKPGGQGGQYQPNQYVGQQGQFGGNQGQLKPQDSQGNQQGSLGGSQQYRQQQQGGQFGGNQGNFGGNQGQQGQFGGQGEQFGGNQGQLKPQDSQGNQQGSLGGPQQYRPQQGGQFGGGQYGGNQGQQGGQGNQQQGGQQGQFGGNQGQLKPQDSQGNQQGSLGGPQQYRQQQGGQFGGNQGQQQGGQGNQQQGGQFGGNQGQQSGQQQGGQFGGNQGQQQGGQGNQQQGGPSQQGGQFGQQGGPQQLRPQGGQQQFQQGGPQQGQQEFQQGQQEGPQQLRPQGGQDFITRPRQFSQSYVGLQQQRLNQQGGPSQQGGLNQQGGSNQQQGGLNQQGGSNQQQGGPNQQQGGPNQQQGGANQQQGGQLPQRGMSNGSLQGLQSMSGSQTISVTSSQIKPQAAPLSVASESGSQGQLNHGQPFSRQGGIPVTNPFVAISNLMIPNEEYFNVS